MKKLSYLLIAASMIILSLTKANAQAQSENNAIKLGISGLAGLEIQLEYERVIKKNLSFQVELIGAIPRRIPSAFTSPFLSMGDGDRYNIQEWVKNKKLAFGLIPELRLYPIKANSMRGFYIAPYAKVRANMYNATGNYKSHHSYADAAFNATVITVGGGLGAGYQFVFGRRGRTGGFVLDIGVAVGCDYHLMTLNSVTNYAAENFEVWAGHIETALSGIPIYGKAFTTTVEGTKVVSKGNMPFVGVRPVLSLGYAFN